jgi:hypothetical protein
VSPHIETCESASSASSSSWPEGYQLSIPASISYSTTVRQSLRLADLALHS